MLGEGSANRLQIAISVPCDCNHHKRSARSPAFGDAVGKDEEALRMAAEAAQMGSGLAKDCFSACLYHLSLCLHAGGKSEQGMNCAKQCVDLRRELVKEYGTWQFTEKLADSLFNLSLYTQPHSPGALQVVREAVKLQQELEGYIPAERFNQRLADGLQNLAALALLAGKAEEALHFVEQAVNSTRNLVELNPSEHTPSLVNVLYTYANVLCAHARYDEGYKAILEADALRQAICGDESIFASLEASAAYLSTRARCLTGLGRHDEGLQELLEAIQLYQKALRKRPYKSTFDSFPWFLKNAVACISGLDRTDGKVGDALKALVELTRLLAGYYPERFNSYLQEALELSASSLCPSSRAG
jgi:tetratricopeptide (TPR) repeat protein